MPAWSRGSGRGSGCEEVGFEGVCKVSSNAVPSHQLNFFLVLFNFVSCNDQFNVYLGLVGKGAV